MVAFRKVVSVYRFSTLIQYFAALAAADASCADSSHGKQCVATATSSALLQKGVQLTTTDSKAVELARVEFDDYNSQDYYYDEHVEDDIDLDTGIVEPPEMVVVVKAVTSSAEYAGTETGANLSFMVDGRWSNSVDFVDEIPEGANIEQSVMVLHRPTKLRITALGPDTWGISSIDVSVDNVTVNLLTRKDPKAPLWVGLDVNDTKPSVTFDIPDMRIKCKTRADERATSYTYTVSPPGTPCVFGVDPRDEGKHCIDEPDYGVFGWCFTSADGTSFGSCDEHCPLIGQDRILGRKIKKTIDAENKIEDLLDDLDESLQDGQDANGDDKKASKKGKR